MKLVDQDPESGNPALLSLPFTTFEEDDGVD